MRRLIGLTMLVFLLGGCQIPDFTAAFKLNTFHIVSYGNDVRHYRAYFLRKNLTFLPNGRRTLLAVHTKTQSPAIVIRRKGYDEVYDMATYRHIAFREKASKHRTLRTLQRFLARRGYRIVNTRNFGVHLTTGPRKYRGYKTWLIDLKDYSRLKRRYLQALRHNPCRLKQLKPIPADLIKKELRLAVSKRLNVSDRTCLYESAKRLHISLPSPQKKPTPDRQNPSFSYYISHASEKELRTLLHTKTYKTRFSTFQQRALRQRLRQLEHDRLLKHGSLEELFAAYKHNKDPRIKQRIMQLLEQRQSNEN